MSIRYYHPELLFEVTSRTVGGAFLFDPVACPEFGPAFHAIIARAQRRYAVKVYAYFAMSNHYHAIYSAPDPDTMADFLCEVHAGMARYANRVLERHGPVFAGRCDVRPILPGDKILPERLCYIMGQAIKADSKWSLVNWPGANTNRALMYGEPVVGRHFDYHQQTLDARRKRGVEVDEAYSTLPEVELSVLPCWESLPEHEIRAKYQAAGAEAWRTFAKDQTRGPMDPMGWGGVQTAEIAGQSQATPPRPATVAPLPEEARKSMTAARPKPAAARKPRDDGRKKKPPVHADTPHLAERFMEAFAQVCAAHAKARADLAEQAQLALRGQQAQAVKFPLYTFAAVARTGRLAAEMGLTSPIGGQR
ncbi:MAG: hypothetical protein FJ100_12055 [Deltaproteobacteria bacterium]|nr:hypothetical protein [Deltaproteobacteria bacterium]